MQDWLEFVIRGLVDRPEAVTVTAVDRDGGTHYELRLDSMDVGKVIGRQGATIHALRALLAVGAAKQGRRYSVDLVEAPGGRERA